MTITAPEFESTRRSRPSLSLVPSTMERDEDRALNCLRGGGLLLAKGDIGYGMLGTSEAALRKMYELKGRPDTNPCVFAGDWDLLDEIAEVQPEERAFLQRVVSYSTCAAVFPAREGSPLLQRLDPWVRAHAITRGTLAVFLRSGPFFERLVHRALREGWCFAGSSANPSSMGNIFRFEEIPEDLVRGVDCAIDHGVAALENPARKATTIINFTNGTLKREGVNGPRIRADFDAWLRRGAVITTAA
jgi:tRNA A37 threonylcarbamoyladenosine synthetase subunit TsaC/SUA5/YrdC